ncbi:DNA repair protein RecO [Anaerovorax odorimutans]|uniref:DNA repair protein RecO n=1 Tax=Anaerovorax odorimutans TaxID=109327 RepID=A0ABT1RM99_9FIRM|nr:DNA repair protein RecO [Anaerovorax odorimutans]MCQ4636309.1 DNA repair protein RecO [Anaerovorax odorimutans]
MITDTEGIILKQIKAAYGRRMVLLFSKKYGKISAGTSISEKGRNKSALAMRPFTYGRYELFKNRDSYNINGAEVLKSYYRIGEDVDKYMNSSYILEFTEKLLVEEQPSQALFNLILDFFSVMENRQKSHGTLVLGYEVKALKIMGVMPRLDRCACCGEICGTQNPPRYFSIKDGGIICEKCGGSVELSSNDTLIYPVSFGIVDILKYFADNSLKNFENLALEENVQKKLQTMIRRYAAYHLDIGDLKSESFLTEY